LEEQCEAYKNENEDLEEKCDTYRNENTELLQRMNKMIVKMSVTSLEAPLEEIAPI
jgi:hypothetical protein